jgi:hypothetical protein
LLSLGLNSNENIWFNNINIVGRVKSLKSKIRKKLNGAPGALVKDT